MYDRYTTKDARYIPAAASGQDRQRQRNRPPEDLSGGLKSVLFRLSSLFQGGLDTEDLLLLGILYLLYLDSKDEDFLILLAVMLFSSLKKG